MPRLQKVDDPIEVLLGLKMKRLETFSFSRLPGNMQREVMDALHFEQKIELVNVTSGFRGHLSRNGVFGRDLLILGLIFEEYDEKDDLVVRVEEFSRGLYSSKTFDFLKYLVLFRNVSSCRRLFLICEGRENEDEECFRKRKDELIKADMDLRRIGGWFPNLRFVERLELDLSNRSPERRLMPISLLSRFDFKVTKFADLGHYWSIQEWLDGFKGPNWEDLLANQLSVCENVFVSGGYYFTAGMPQEISGMEIEHDLKKVNDIWRAVTRAGSLRLCYWGCSWGRFYGQQFEKANCYRRKVGKNKEMVMAIGCSN